MSKKRGRPWGSKNKPKTMPGYSLVPLQTLIESLDPDCLIPIPQTIADEIVSKHRIKSNIIIEVEEKELVEGVDFTIENV